MAKAGKILGLISPILAVGAMALMLFGSTYSYQAGDSAGNLSSGTITAFRYAFEEGDNAWFHWAVIVIAVCLVAAAGALAGRTAPVWVCASALWVVAVLGIWSIGLFVLPLSIVLFVSAALLTLARYESRTQ